MKNLLLVLLLVAVVSTGSAAGSGTASSDLSYFYLRISGYGGSVAMDPTGRQVECSNDICAYEYPTGTRVTLRVIAYAGAWMRWSGLPGISSAPACGIATVCSVTVTGKMGKEAQFNPVQLRIGSNDSSWGWVEFVDTQGSVCGQNCRRYPYGGTARIRAHANEGYSFSGWYGGCEGIGEGCIRTMRRDAFISAIFTCHLEACSIGQPITRPKGYVPVIVRGPGSVSFLGITCRSSCRASAREDQMVSIRAYPDPGASIAGWSGPFRCSNCGSRLNFPVFFAPSGDVPTITISFQ
jgi:hypothetical protein